MERTVLYQDGSGETTSLVEGRFNDRTTGLAVWIGLEVQHIGLQEYLLQQQIYVQTVACRDILILILTTPALHQIVHGRELLAHLHGVGGWLINLVDSKDDRHTGSRSVVDGLLGLRHHAVVGSDDDNSNIGHLGTTGTHGSKCLVSRSIEEGDSTAVVQLHRVGTDVLGDTTGLTGNDVGIADIVEQLGLTVINVTHDGDDRWTGHQLIFGIGLLLQFLFNLLAHVLSLEAELLGHQVDGVGIQTLVDRNHQSQSHTGRDDLDHRHVHHRSEVIGCHELGEFQDLALCCFLLFGLGGTFGSSITLVLSVLDIFLVTLVRQAGQGVTNRTLDILFRYLVLLVLLTLVVAVLTQLVTILTTGIAMTLLVTTAAVVALLDLFVDIYLLGTVVTVACLLLGSIFLLTLFLALLLRLLLRTSGLVDRVQVDGSHDVNLWQWSCLGAEHLAVTGRLRQWIIVDTVTTALPHSRLVRLLGRLLLRFLFLRFLLLRLRLLSHRGFHLLFLHGSWSLNRGWCRFWLFLHRCWSRGLCHRFSRLLLGFGFSLLGVKVDGSDHFRTTCQFLLARRMSLLRSLYCGSPSLFFNLVTSLLTLLAFTLRLLLDGLVLVELLTQQLVLLVGYIRHGQRLTLFDGEAGLLFQEFHQRLYSDIKIFCYLI